MKDLSSKYYVINIRVVLYVTSQTGLSAFHNQLHHECLSIHQCGYLKQPTSTDMLSNHGMLR